MEMIIVKSKIKEVSGDCNVSGDFAEALNKLALAEIKSANDRAESNNRKTIQARDIFLGEITSETMIVVKSKIKEVVKYLNVGGDFASALNEVLIYHVSNACARATANGRKTVSAKDL